MPRTPDGETAAGGENARAGKDKSIGGGDHRGTHLIGSHSIGAASSAPDPDDSKGSDAADKWRAERSALRKVQVHFTFTAYATHCLKHEAVDRDMTASNLVRKIVGLPFDASTRQRIGLSLTDRDFTALSSRYGVPVADRAEIKRRVTEEVNLRYHDRDSRQ